MAQVEIVDRKTVKSLYHYQKFNIDWLKNLLTGGTIYFSNPATFNDPWDCKPYFDLSFVGDTNKYKKQLKYFEHAYKTKYPRHARHERRAALKRFKDPGVMVETIKMLSHQMQDEIQKQCRIYCMSETGNIPLVWAHYSDKHRGVCLEFSTENTFFSSAYKVQYSREYPIMPYWENSLEGTLLPLVTKSDDWSYETEYRVMALEKDHAKTSWAHLQSHDGFICVPRGSLKSIILGCLASGENFQAVNDLVKATGAAVTVRRAKMCPDKYALSVE